MRLSVSRFLPRSCMFVPYGVKSRGPGRFLQQVLPQRVNTYDPRSGQSMQILYCSYSKPKGSMETGTHHGHQSPDQVVA